MEAAAEAEVRARRLLSYTSSGAHCLLLCPGRGFSSEPPRGLSAWADSSTAPAAAAVAAATACGGAPTPLPHAGAGKLAEGSEAASGRGCGSFRTLAPRAGGFGCFVPQPPGCAECNVLECQLGHSFSACP